MTICLVNITHDTDPTSSPVPVTGGACPLLNVILEKKDIQTIRDHGFTVEVLKDPYDEAAIQREKAAALLKALHGNVDRTPAPRQVKPVAPTIAELSPKRRPVRVVYRRAMQETVAPVEVVEKPAPEVQHVEPVTTVTEPVNKAVDFEVIDLQEISPAETFTSTEEVITSEETVPEGEVSQEASPEGGQQEPTDDESSEESEEMSAEELDKLRSDVKELKTMAQAKKLLEQHGIDLGNQMPSNIKDLRKLLLEMIDS